MNEPEPGITLTLIDDHALVREGIRAIIEREPDIHVLAEYEAIDAALTAGLTTTIAVVDLHLAGGLDLDAVSGLIRSFPETAAIILTMLDHPPVVRSCLEAGARGYVLKEAASSTLVTAVRKVAGGGTFVQETLLDRLFAYERRRVPALTDREHEVLRLLTDGLTNAEIAEAASMSLRTVESHRAHLLEKLGETSRAGLIRRARELGLLYGSGWQADSR